MVPLGGFRRKARRRGLVAGAAIASRGKEQGTQQPQTSQTQSSSPELTELEKLRDEGVITSDEYETRKNQILN